MELAQDMKWGSHGTGFGGGSAKGQEKETEDIKSKKYLSFIRLMNSCQKGYETLINTRRKGRQEMVVQHVHVQGQAVVANKMKYDKGDTQEGHCDEE